MLENFTPEFLQNFMIQMGCINRQVLPFVLYRLILVLDMKLYPGSLRPVGRIQQRRQRDLLQGANPKGGAGRWPVHTGVEGNRFNT